MTQDIYRNKSWTFFFFVWKKSKHWLINCLYMLVSFGELLSSATSSRLLMCKLKAISSSLYLLMLVCKLFMRSLRDEWECTPLIKEADWELECRVLSVEGLCWEWTTVAFSRAPCKDVLGRYIGRLRDTSRGSSSSRCCSFSLNLKADSTMLTVYRLPWSFSRQQNLYSTV